MISHFETGASAARAGTGDDTNRGSPVCVYTLRQQRFLIGTLYQFSNTWATPCPGAIDGRSDDVVEVIQCRGASARWEKAGRAEGALWLLGRRSKYIQCTSLARAD